MPGATPLGPDLTGLLDASESFSSHEAPYADEAWLNALVRVHDAMRAADVPFYLAYAMFRYAAMVQGVLHRYTIGTASNTKVAHTQERVAILAAKARSLLMSGA